MNAEKTFLDILKESKEEIETIKKFIKINKDIINKEFEIKSNSEILKHSPLTYCLEKKFSEISIFLIEQGANINYKTYPNEDYPLLLACRYGLEDVVKKLLLYDNLNINCLNKKNETCYTISLNNQNVIIYNLILNHVNSVKKASNKKNEKNEKKDNNDNNNNQKRNLNKIIMTNNISFDILLNKKSNYYSCRFGKFNIYLKYIV
jgi:hypothetical protein